MSAVKIALVGIGGYGKNYLDMFASGEISRNEGIISCGVDPIAANQHDKNSYFSSNNIPIYESLEDMYKSHPDAVELVIISSPTPFHMQQCLFALKNNSHVLCEKPLVPIAQQATQLLHAEKNSNNRRLAVGFQWSFSKTMTSLKTDILNGKYGKPVIAKTFLSSPRPINYYTESTWKGRIFDKQNQPVLDSIFANATAHYAHNMFFMLGQTMDTSLMPSDISMELYRANAIQSFDTCFIRGNFESGAKFFYSGSHATSVNHPPVFYYEFEKGFITFNFDKYDNIVRGYLNSGQDKIVYGNPFTPSENAQKVKTMINRVRHDIPVICSVKTILPHLLVSNATFDFGKISDFPKDIISQKKIIGQQVGNHVDSLYNTLYRSFLTAQLPSELNISWSVPMQKISLKNYKGFTGQSLKN